MKTSLLIAILVCICGVKSQVTSNSSSKSGHVDESAQQPDATIDSDSASEEFSDESQTEPFSSSWNTIFDDPYSIVTSIVDLPTDAVPETQAAIQGLIQEVGNSPLQSFLEDILLLLPMKRQLQQIDIVLARLYDFAEPATPTIPNSELVKKNMNALYQQPIIPNVSNSQQYNEQIDKVLIKKLQDFTKDMETKVTDIEKEAEARLDRLYEAGKLRRETAIEQLLIRDEILGKKFEELDTEMKKMEEALESKTADVDVRVQSMQKTLTDKKDEVESRLKAIERRMAEKLQNLNSAVAESANQTEKPPNAPDTANELSESAAPVQPSPQNSGIPVEELDNTAQIETPVSRSSSRKKGGDKTGRKKTGTK